VNAENKKTATDTKDEHDARELPLVEHLMELRDRILRSFAVLLIVFFALVYWANDIYEFVSEPLTAVLDANVGQQIIATKVLDPFLTPFKLTFFVAFVISVPYILHQIWAFVSPGLYKNEIRVALPIITSSVLLFYTGIAFSYFFVLGFLFRFIIDIAPENVTVMTDITAYLDFVMGLFLAFGLVFEIPVATVLLVLSGIVTPKALAENRPYVIIGCFLVAVPITPPDPFSMLMLAIPMCLLFEAGLYASRLVYRPDPDEAAPAAAEKK
jgi:sec-independent protein translocase protein TatC